MLALFAANVPAHFAPDERGWLDDSLDDLEGPAFIATVESMVAFGGYERWEYYDKALLFGRMAHLRNYGRGLGRWLLVERFALIAEENAA